MGKTSNKLTVTIDILGDISLSENVLSEIELDYVTKKINQNIGSVDYRIANLESPIVEASKDKIQKFGPNLKADLKALKFLKDLDVNAYTLANNHIGDYGKEGIVDTKRFLDNINKEYVGTEYYETLVAQEYPVLRKEMDLKISIISICENEFGISRPMAEGTCGFDPRRIQVTIAAEKKWADYIVIVFHGGIENYPFPSPMQRQRYHTLVDQGANVVVGMHSHCPVGYEVYNGSPIIYGTGNFYFPQKYPSLYQSWNYGYIVRLQFNAAGSVGFSIIPYKVFYDGRDFEVIKESWMQLYLNKLCSMIADEQKLMELFYQWASMRGRILADFLSVKINSCSIEELCSIKNMITCEAHNEVLRTYLSILYESKNGLQLSVNDIVDESRANEIKKYISIDQFEKQKPFNNSAVCQILWGYGVAAHKKYAKLSAEGYAEQEILLVDNDTFKQGLFYNGNKIISPKDAMQRYKTAAWNICTSRKYFNEIHSMLIQNGVPDNNIQYISN